MHINASLSTSRQRLVRMIGDIGFGAIERLFINDGEPEFGPETILIRDKKFGKRDTSSAHELRESPLSKIQFEQLFEEFADMGNGEVILLEFQNGLPFKIRTREPIGI